METERRFKQMRIVGGNLALDFANTFSGASNGQPVTDALDNYQDLLGWAHQVGAIDHRQVAALARAAQERPRVASTVFRRSVRLRACLAGIFGDLANHREPLPAALELLRDEAASSLRYARLSRTRASFTWDWGDCGDLTAPLWPITQAAVDLVRCGPLERVKRCGGCPFLFLDSSKNDSRRWCSMEDCGTAAKMHNYVARRSASRQSVRATRPEAG